VKFFRPILPFCAVFLNEHTYAMDYGANTAAYIDAFFKKKRPNQRPGCTIRPPSRNSSV
jgi:adenine-specific DNA methylase